MSRSSGSAATRRRGDRDGTSNPEGRIRLASKMVGRWPSGTPLVRSPEKDDPAFASDNEFLYRRVGRRTRPQVSDRGAHPPHEPSRLPRARIPVRTDQLRSASVTESSDADACTGHQWQARWRSPTLLRPAMSRVNADCTSSVSTRTSDGSSSSSSTPG